MARNGRELGKVKKWIEEKGFGFITRANGGKDVFIHYSNINMHGRKSLEAGQTVEFDVEETDKGPQARDLEVISDY